MGQSYKTEKFIVYGLVDPRNGQLRYIGQTSRPLNVRLRHHIYRGLRKKTNTYKANWVKSIINSGLEPDIVALAEYKDAETLAKAEVFWIMYFKLMGLRLTNLTSGGEGARGYRHTEETKDKLSKMTRQQAIEAYGVYEKENLSLIATARRHGVSKKVIVAAFKRCGLKIRQYVRPTKISKCDVNEMYRMYQTDGAEKVGKAFGLAPGTVLIAFRQNGLRVRRSGEHRALLTDIQVSDAYRLYDSGELIKEVAKMFDVCANTMSEAFAKRGLKIHLGGQRARIGFTEIKIQEAYLIYSKDKLSLRKVGKIFGVSGSFIHTLFLEAGLKIRNSAEGRWATERVRKSMCAEGV